MYKYYCIGLTAVVLYLNGFFPISHKINVTSKRHENTQQEPPEKNNPVSAKYDKVVFMVVDALRLDFVTSELTPKLWNSLQDKGCFARVKAETPTVTMPRIKALTTGSVPQFIDIVFNLAHISPLKDSFVHRAHENGKRIVFYGDDTWVKLFPDLFRRYEGTTSFYVNDFDEVDHNVTRNVKLELENINDWDFMILHYLGLDHIGHVLGPRSPKIQEKLLEMDTIFHEIFTKLTSSSERFLILVTGDHGMKDSGGHGGSTFAETTVPLAVVGMNCLDDAFSQIDIPANLALLLGHDIPNTSIGQLKLSLLQDLSPLEYLDALKYNTELLRQKLDLCKNTYNAAANFHSLFHTNHNREIGLEARKLYEKCSKEISNRMISTSVRQDDYDLFIAIMACVWLLLILMFAKSKSISSPYEAVAVLVILLFQLCDLEKGFSWAFAVVIVLGVLKNIFMAFPLMKFFTLSANIDFPLLVSLLKPSTFFSSSYIEEEHQLWYFFACLYMLTNAFLCFEKKKIKTAVSYTSMLVSIRFLRTLNQVGDRWAALPDLADWLLQKENYYYWYSFLIVGLILNCISLTLIDINHKIHFTTNVIILMLIYFFRTHGQENASLGKFIWFCILLKGVHVGISKSNITSVWILMITLLLKPHNIILVPACTLASTFFHRRSQNCRTIVFAHLWLGGTFFFLQGHCNSLASVDVSSGYIGLNEYQAAVVMVQVLIHTYAFSILSHLLLFKNPQIDRTESFSIFFMYRLYVTLVIFIVAFIQRYHLFIWSVFAPKLIVETSHFCVLFIEVSCYYIMLLLNKKM